MDFVRVKTPFNFEQSEVEKSRFRSCFKSAENWATNSLRVGGHRSKSILCMSKLIWVKSNFKSKKLATAAASLSDLILVILGADL